MSLNFSTTMIIIRQKPKSSPETYAYALLQKSSPLAFTVYLNGYVPCPDQCLRCYYDYFESHYPKPLTAADRSSPTSLLNTSLTSEPLCTRVCSGPSGPWPNFILLDFFTQPI